MEQAATDKKTDALESKFLDFMQQGDDFFKIELLRHAKNCYNKALELNYETESVRQKIAECNRLLKFEGKVIWILLILVAIISFLFFTLGF